MFGDNGVSLYSGLFDLAINKHEGFQFKDPVYTGIIILDNIIAFVSNGFLSNEKNAKNKIIFCRITYELIKIKEIEVPNTFNLTNNYLHLMEYSKNQKKLLLCACKKYQKEQKNGILLVNFDFKVNEQIEIDFKKTGSFEVYCFCQLYYYKNDDNKTINKDNIKKKTNYFLVGGFETNKHKGIIKLYELIYHKKKQKINIRYIEDIILENNSKSENIRAPISCIIQSENNGDILATSWDKNIYIFNCNKENYDLRKKMKKNRL
jgi:hypothetical protein